MNYKYIIGCVGVFLLHICLVGYRYGFKETPKLELVAKPRLGKKAVTLSQVTHWIERKLCSLVDVSEH